MSGGFVGPSVATVQAPAAVPTLAKESGSSGSGTVTFVVASAVVIALAYAASRLLSRWQAVQNRGRRLRVLEGVPVGKDCSLMLVAVGQEVLVVGASPGGINLVHRVEDSQAAADLLVEPKPEVVADLPPLEGEIRRHLDRMRSLLGRQGGRGHG